MQPALHFQQDRIELLSNDSLCKKEITVSRLPPTPQSPGAGSAVPTSPLEPAALRWDRVKRRRETMKQPPLPIYDDVMALVGLEALKDWLLSLYFTVYRDRSVSEQAGTSFDLVLQKYQLNTRIEGESGTGKSTVAYLYARVLQVRRFPLSEHRRLLVPTFLIFRGTGRHEPISALSLTAHRSKRSGVRTRTGLCLRSFTSPPLPPCPATFPSAPFLSFRVGPGRVAAEGRRARDRSGRGFAPREGCSGTGEVHA